MSNLSKETSERIYADASKHSENWYGHDDVNKDYLEGALHEAERAQEEIEQLKRWKMEAVELLTQIHSYVHKNMEVSLGQCNVKLVIDRCKQYETACAILEKAIAMDEIRDHDLMNEIKTFLDGTK